jgi:hypothetical protein
MFTSRSSRSLQALLERAIFSSEYQPLSIWRSSRRITSSWVFWLPVMFTRRT